MSDYTLHLGDCLDVLPQAIPDQSIDAIITDLPYGTTACAWDVVIPFAPMWAQVKRVLKPRGVFVTTASQPFTSMLIMSNLEWFKYCWIWRKNNPTGFQFSKTQPMRAYEDIAVFYTDQCVYNAQTRKTEIADRRVSNGMKNGRGGGVAKISDIPILAHPFNEDVAPHNVLSFDVVSRSIGTEHPTQKPVALYEYLIRTYTNHGATVLDIAAGSGTTGVACMRTGRDFIGVEKEREYYDIAQKRISEAAAQPALFHLDAPTINPTQTALDFTPEASPTPSVTTTE